MPMYNILILSETCKEPHICFVRQESKSYRKQNSLKVVQKTNAMAFLNRESWLYDFYTVNAMSKCIMN